MFKHIFCDQRGWNLSRYFQFVQENLDKWPQPLRDFIAHPKNYGLRGRETLHDTRLLSATVQNAHSLDYHDPVAGVQLKFVDQMHEGVITLRYGKVSGFRYLAPRLENYRTADVLMHEFDIQEGGLSVHRISIDQGGEIEVVFETFSRSWKPLTEI